MTGDKINSLEKFNITIAIKNKPLCVVGWACSMCWLNTSPSAFMFAPLLGACLRIESLLWKWLFRSRLSILRQAPSCL